MFSRCRSCRSTLFEDPQVVPQELPRPTEVAPEQDPWSWVSCRLVGVPLVQVVQRVVQTVDVVHVVCEQRLQTETPWICQRIVVVPAYRCVHVCQGIEGQVVRLQRSSATSAYHVQILYFP